jgi:hypothetical protein
VKTVEEIKKRMGDAIRFVSPDDAEADMVLVVTGCQTACADIKPSVTRPIFFVTSRDDVDTFIDEVKKI